MDIENKHPFYPNYIDPETGLFKAELHRKQEADERIPRDPEDERYHYALNEARQQMGEETGLYLGISDAVQAEQLLRGRQRRR